MKSFQSAAAILFAVSSFATLAGCAAETAPTSEPVGESADAIAASKVKLPSGDPCRDVLGPLSLGLADGARGLAYTSGITVSLTSAADTRFYTVSIAGEGSPYVYEVELDNDSASMCLLLSATTSQTATLENDRRSKATNAELRVTAPISVSPRGDDCASTVKLLAQGAAVSAVGEKFIQKIDVTLESETEDRDYGVHVDGKSFKANGQTFPNDYDFALNMSNDSASKCFVQSVTRK